MSSVGTLNTSLEDSSMVTLTLVALLSSAGMELSTAAVTAFPRVAALTLAEAASVRLKFMIILNATGGLGG